MEPAGGRGQMTGEVGLALAVLKAAAGRGLNVTPERDFPSLELWLDVAGVDRDAYLAKWDERNG